MPLGWRFCDPGGGWRFCDLGVDVSATSQKRQPPGRRNVNPQVAETSTQGHYFGIVFFKFLATGFESGWTAYTIQISSRSFIIWNQVAFLVNHPFKFDNNYIFTLKPSYQSCQTICNNLNSFSILTFYWRTVVVFSDDTVCKVRG